MPLRYTDDPASLESLNNIPEEYVIFYSSRDENGRMWCPVGLQPLMLLLSTLASRLILFASDPALTNM